MAFSKSKFKRFNETMSCAPPVGSYDVALHQRSMIGTFDKSTRFKVPKEPFGHNSMLRPSMSMDSLLVEKTPVKLFENGVKNSAKGKKIGTPHQPDLNRKIAEMEKEIKNLLLQRTEQDKVLAKKQDEMMKLDSRLHVTLQEKSSLEASLAATEKELSSVRKAKDVLMNKVDSVESNSLKKHEEMQSQIHEATSKIKDTEKEMSRLQDELTSQVRHLEADLEEASSKIVALKETKSMQEKLTKDAKKYNEEIELQVTQLQGIINQVRVENTQVQQQLEETRSKNEILSTENEELKLLSDQEMVKQKSMESMLNENLKSLSEKYQLLEVDYTTCQTARKKETDQLRFELDALHSTSAELESEQNNLQKQNVELTESIEKHKEIGIKLEEQLVAAEQQYEFCRKEFNEYKEQAENDQLVLSEAKNSLLTLSSDLEVKMKSLDAENKLLQMDLSRHAETFEEMTRDKTVLLNKMTDLSIQKQGLLECKQALLLESDIKNEQLKKLQEDSENLKKEKEMAYESKMKLEKEMNEQLDSAREELQKVKDEFGKRLVDTQTKCSSKAAEIEKLGCQIESLEESLKSTCSTGVQLQEKITKLEEQKISLNDKIAQLEHNHQSEISNRKTEIETLSTNLKQMQAEKQEMEQNKIEYEEKAECEIRKLEDKMKRMQEEFEEQYSLMQTKYTTAESEVQRLRSQIESLEKDLQSTFNEGLKLQETIEKMEEQKNALNDKFAALEHSHQSEITNRNAEIETLSANLKEAEEEKQEMEQERNEYEQIKESEIKQLEDSIRSMQEEFKDQYSLMQNKCSTAESETQRLGSQIELLEENLHSTNDEGLKLQEKITELEQQKSALNNKITELENNHLSELTDRDSVIDTLSINLKQTKEENQEMEQKKKEYEKIKECEMKQLEDNIKTMQEEFKEQHSLMQTKCTTAESETQRLCSQIKTLEENLQSTFNKDLKLQEKINELEEEKCTLNEKFAELQHNHLSDITHRDTEIETLSTNLKQRQEEKQEMEQKRKEYEKMVECEIKQLEENIKKMQEEFEEQYSLMQTNYTEAESEVQRLNQQIHTLEENIENNIQDQNQVQHHAQEMEQENSALCERIDNMKEIIDSNHIEFEKEKKIYQEKLNNMEKELIEIEEIKNQIVEDMQTKLNETQTVKAKYENRIATLQEQSEETEAHSQRLEERISHLEHHIEAEKENTKQLFKNNQKLCDERSGLTYKISHLEANNTSLSEAVEMWSSKFQELTAEKQEMSERMNEVEKENLKLSDRISDLQEAAHNHVCNEENNEAFEEEILKWQTLYEDLHEKVAPFKEQLDQFELERKYLLSKSSQAQSEIEKLSQDYAKLLGHQNTKQKIQHVQKLKQENLTLKQEVSKLREQNVKYLRQMKTAIDRNPMRKRFNPSEAFKSSKENKFPLGTHN